MAKSKELVFDLTNIPNKETLEEFETIFKTSTIAEIADKYETSTSDVLAMHEAWGIQAPINIARTYSGGLIPNASQFAKYQTPKQRAKYNKGFDWDANKEYEFRTKHITELEYALGSQLATCTVAFDKLAEIQKDLKFQKGLQQAYEHAKEKDDWLSYVEEERYGIRPVKEDKFSTEIFSDNVMYSYIAERYGISKLYAVQKLLEEGE